MNCSRHTLNSPRSLLIPEEFINLPAWSQSMQIQNNFLPKTKLTQSHQMKYSPQNRNIPKSTLMVHLPPNITWPLNPWCNTLITYYAHTDIISPLFNQTLLLNRSSYQALKLSRPQPHSFLPMHQFIICQRCLIVLAFRRTTVTWDRHMNYSFSAH